MTILFHKPYLVKVTTKGVGGQKYPKNDHEVYERLQSLEGNILLDKDLSRIEGQKISFLTFPSGNFTCRMINLFYKILDDTTL